MKKIIKKKPAAQSSRKKKPLVKHGRWVGNQDFTRLQESLREAQETLEAIRGGEVDAVVVQGPRGSQIYSLSGAEQPYRVYVERMQEGAATISADGLILYANRRFAEMVMQPLERVMGSSAPLFLEASAWEKISGVFASANVVVKCESIMQRPDQTILPVNLTASSLPMEAQTVLCLVVTDLSAQKQNEELRFAKEVAEKANLAKDAFLAALSHELRTPLNPVLLLASEAVENYDLPPRVRADFATIRNSVELESRLIDDLLDLTRISHGKLALNLALADSHAVLNNALATVKSELHQKKIALTLDLEKTPCLIRADAIRLQQVFWNVLKNAVKFTPEKGQVKIKTRANHDKKQLTITVTDTGIGMTREEIRRIFDTFVQGDHAKSAGMHQFGGLGLGLSISKMLITMHNGVIEASSEGRGKGATFTIQLPLAAMTGNGEMIGPVDGVRKTTNGGPHARISILLVEDHEPTRNALTRLLLNRKHAVVATGSAIEARELAGKQYFHLVISDIGLPDGNGFDLMKELNGRYNLKGIALTGYGMEQDVLTSQKSGFVTHLTKPVRIQSLESALENALLSCD